MGMGACCCTTACCVDRIFRGDSSNAVNTLTVEFQLWGDTVEETSPGSNVFCPTGDVATLLETSSPITLTYATSIPEAYDQPINLNTGAAHPIGRILYRPSGWYVSGSMDVADLGDNVFSGSGVTGRLAFAQLADFTTGTPTAEDVPGIGSCCLMWVFDSEQQATSGQTGWDRYTVDFRRQCFADTPAFTPWFGQRASISPLIETYRGMWFGGGTATTCAPILVESTGVSINTARTTLYPGATDYLLSNGSNVSTLRGSIYQLATITE